MIEVLKRDGDYVLWCQNDCHYGYSQLQGGQVSDTVLFDPAWMLTPRGTKLIIQAVKDWLDETGEGEKWLEENS
jgi:hypothetical protein